MDSIKKSYSELITLKTFDERIEYLKTHADNPGNKDRRIMNKFYKSQRWENVRDKVIQRDLANDLGILNLEVQGTIIVHHINPITTDDVLNDSPLLLDMDNLICVSYDTHGKIHYLSSEREETVLERTPNDTKLW